MDARDLAHRLRGDSTPAERRLWIRLSRRQCGGWRFRRQHPVPPYVADFACLRLMLIVEVDGEQHAGSAHDARRDAALSAQGWRVLRFWNAEVIRNTDGVVETILHMANERGRALGVVPVAAGERAPSQPPPLREGGDSQ